MDLEALQREIELQQKSPAPMKKRVLSYTIDEIVVSVLIMIAFWNVLSEVKTSAEYYVVMGTIAWYVLLLKLIYHTFFVFMYGKTPGKMIMGITIFDYRFQKPSFFQSLWRSFLRIISEMGFYLGFFIAFFEPLNRAFHDIFSKVIILDD